MRSRLLVAAIGVPVLLYVVLWAPPVVLALSLGLLAAVAAWELMHCVGAEKFMPLTAAAIAGAAAFVANAYAPGPALSLALVGLTVWVFLFAVLKAGEVKLLHICAALGGMFAIPFAFTAFLRLDGAGYHRGFLLLPLVFSFMSDTFGYFVGRAMGKHKLAPKVSPKKTVEGAIGGLLGGVIGMTVFKLVADSMAHTLTVYPPIEMAAGPQISWGAVFALGIIGSTISQIGDLSFSVIKREFGVKDYGNLLPGHGGILDRFDSVTFVAPFVWLALQLL